MSAKDLIDGVRRDVSLPLPLARYRDLIARLAFGRPYSAIIAAERAGELAAPAIHESDLPELTRVFGKHVPALVVAVRAHIAIYRDRHQLTSVAIPIVTNGIYLTAYWRNRSAPHQSREEGRETLQINLSKPLTELLKRHEFRTTPNVGGFRFEAEDHLECQADIISQGLARHALLAAAGTLKFLEATGLRPVTRYARLTELRIEKLPGLDHSSDWVDPSTNARVVLDEPYRNVDSIARAAWIEGSGLHMIAPDWGGLYRPGSSRPYVVARDPQLLDRLGVQLAALGKVDALVWTGESGTYSDRFVSPVRKDAGKSARARTMPARPGTTRAGAIAYGGWPGSKGRWRPEVPMGVNLHEKAGALLQGLSYKNVEWRVESLMEEVRADLADWLLAEDKDSTAEPHDFYFGSPSGLCSTDVRSAAVELITILRSGYADCSPRRKMIKQLEKFIARIDKLPNIGVITDRVRTAMT